ncbi:MAG: uracil-DNA glycosylase [Duodenibacillus sp.]|nr:uracil-DNA glycosylase [Duodenibacillus sp.]
MRRQVLKRQFNRGETVPGRAGALLRQFWETPAGMGLAEFLDERTAAGATIFPEDPYRALRLTPLESVRVVIVGQDPYPTAGHAMGLAFAVNPLVRPLPRSLNNIYKELQEEFARSAPRCGDLSGWAKQGVLLINAALTVEEGQAGAHAGKGWEQLTDALIGEAAAGPRPCVFMLWGAAAQKKEELIARARVAPSLILKANHPSPLSARRPPVPFLGCGHFRKANEWLSEKGERPVDWFDIPQDAGEASLF